MPNCIDVKPVYYYEENGGSMVTDDREYALSNHNFQLACLSDLEDMSCVGIFFKDFIVEAADGYYVWYESTYKTILDEIVDCGYIEVKI